jgi:putative endonuclease
MAPSFRGPRRAAGGLRGDDFGMAPSLQDPRRAAGGLRGDDELWSHSRVSGNLTTLRANIPVDILFKDEDMDYISPCVYILANRPHGVLYIGVSSNLARRVWEHKSKLVDGFSRRYDTDRLVWYEQHADIYSAITRERQLKKWNRNWKIELIEKLNPEWKDLYDDIQ